ncbi:hypothetical protein EN829_061235, partial [Mesorhizobium sp. M00.F.Ca.ET.186.01.1.1]
MEPHLKREAMNRWRLLLGAQAEDALEECGDYSRSDFAYRELDSILDFLYGREHGEEQGYRKEGGREGSTLTVPTWLQKIRKLFPKETVEILEKQALERYNMTELLTDKKVLESLEPNMTLLK